MSLYTVGSVPLAMNDALMHTNSPAMGATKAALDLAFGAGALRIAGDLMPKVGQRLPSNPMMPRRRDPGCGGGRALRHRAVRAQPSG
ncbi:hypothetical protein ACU4HD_43900 [Cupriavidus basilensis]